MKYLMLIYQAKASEDMLAEIPDLGAKYGVFTQSIKDSGHYLGGDALRSVASATTVRVKDGKTMVTDGPFAETREQLVGFYAIEAEHLDDAIAIAARIPSATFGSVEVRPIMTERSAPPSA
jgi:hypothetical protein